MIRVTAVTDDAGARAFVVDLDRDLGDRTALNKVLGRRLRNELVKQFRSRRDEPNKMGAPKTGFWDEIASATGQAEADAKGATVTIADHRVRLQVFGGTVKPKTKKALTIPLIAEARDKKASQYENDTGHKLFRVGNALVEKTGTTARGPESGRSTTIPLAGGRDNGIRPVYALAKSATIKADPKALPEEETIIEALRRTAERFVERRAKGGRG